MSEKSKMWVAISIVVGVVVWSTVHTIFNDSVVPSDTNTETTIDYARTEFVGGCVDGDYAMYDFCSCAYTYLESKYGVAGIIELGESMELPKSVQTDLINQCL